MKRLAVILPYNTEHIDNFIAHFEEFMKDKEIDYSLFFIKQRSNRPLNKGKLFNIGYFLNKDDFDYFCFHDIDLIPISDECSYEYEEKPISLTNGLLNMEFGDQEKIDNFDYFTLPYDGYFGGAILFTKEHYQKANGYSNGYFNWGMEDDDLFYRVKKKGLAEKTFMNHKSDEPRNFLRFNGLNDYVKIIPSDSIREITSGNFTISVLVRAEDRFDIPKYLIGDIENRKFIHQYIFGRPSFQMGIGWDNSDAYSFGLFNQKNNHSYMWIKRHPDIWTHLMITVNVDKNEMRFYLNGRESDSRFGHGSQSPLGFESPLKKYGGNPFYLGVGDPNKEESNFFSGDIAQVSIWNKVFDDSERQEYYKTDYPKPVNPKLYYDFSKIKDGIVYDLSGNGNHGILKGCSVGIEPIGKIQHTTLPYRNRPGRFFSQHHERNDMVGGKWVHQKDTSVNEKRFVEEVQGEMINIDEDGLTDLNYTVVKKEKLFGTEHEIINFKCEQDIPDHVGF